MERKELTPEECKARWERMVANLAEHGFTEWAAPDHPIYSEGASTILLGTASECIIEPEETEIDEAEHQHYVECCELNSTTRKIFSELKSDYLHCNHSLEASDVTSLIELDEDAESVSWISSTWIEPRAVNLHICTIRGESDNVFATEHGDRGVLVEINGPWESVEDAKKSYGFVKEGWSDL